MQLCLPWLKTVEKSLKDALGVNVTPSIAGVSKTLQLPRDDIQLHISEVKSKTENKVTNEYNAVTPVTSDGEMR